MNRFYFLTVVAGTSNLCTMPAPLVPYSCTTTVRLEEIAVAQHMVCSGSSRSFTLQNPDRAVCYPFPLSDLPVCGDAASSFALFHLAAGNRRSHARNVVLEYPLQLIKPWMMTAA